MSYIVIIVILIIFSAFFSSSETILFLAKDIGLTKNNKKYKYIYDNQEEFLTIILFSNTIVNIFLGMTFEYYASNILFKNISIIYVILSTTFILLLFGEVLPKRLSLTFYKILYKKYFEILLFLEKGLKYINIFFKIIIQPFKNLKKEEQYFTFDETKYFLYDSYKNKIISKLEFQLFYRIFSLKNIKVSKLLIPYTKMAIFTLERLKDILINDFNRIINLEQDFIPLYDNDFKEIIGAIKKKALLRLFYNDNNSFNNDLINNLEKIIIKPVFVYIDQQLDQIFSLINENVPEILFVFDQYYQFKGILKYEDIQNYLLTLDIIDHMEDVVVNPFITNEELKYFYNINIPSRYKYLHQFLLPFVKKRYEKVRYKKYIFRIYYDESKILYNKESSDKNNSTKLNLIKNKDRKNNITNIINLNYKIKIIKANRTIK